MQTLTGKRHFENHGPSLRLELQQVPPATPKLDFYRPRFLVLPTGRSIYGWGVFETSPGKPLPIGIPQMSDFVSRHRNLGLAYKAARKLNEQQAVAA